MDKDEQRRQVVNEVAGWIDTQVLAEMIVSHLEDEGLEVTLDQCKETWYGTLENLGGGVGLAI